jgi:hypothetical protein
LGIRKMGEETMIALCRRVSLALVLFASTAHAADVNGNYRFWGAGGITCKAYVEMAGAQNADFDKVSLWVAGYLTSYNRFSDKTYDIVEKDGNISSVMLWMLNYCNKNSDKALSAAVNVFIDDHKDKRIVSAP